MSEQLNLDSLRDALISLESALRVTQHQAWLDAPDSDAIRTTLIAGVIQNFEFVFELITKFIRRVLEAEAFDPAEIDHANFRDILRSAGEKGLITNVEAWFGYRKLRNMTSHTYDQEKAQIVFAQIPAFLAEGKHLLEVLEKRNA